MKHIFQKGKSQNKDQPTLLLLHGTGGTETDLLPVAEKIQHTASMLGVRGKVDENGMSRFFRRFPNGELDEKDMIFRTEELNEFLNTAAVDYSFNRDNVIALGYSNGANIAGSLLFHYPDAVKGAILFHPVVPRRGTGLPNLAKVPVFISAGATDPYVSPKEAVELADLLRNAGANVTLNWSDYGHQLTGSEIEAAAMWFAEHFNNA